MQLKRQLFWYRSGDAISYRNGLESNDRDYVKMRAESVPIIACDGDQSIYICLFMPRPKVMHPGGHPTTQARPAPAGANQTLTALLQAARAARGFQRSRRSTHN